MVLPRTEWWCDPRRVGSMEPAPHVILLLDDWPGRGAELQHHVPGGRAAVPAHLLARHRRALPRQVLVFDGHGKSSMIFFKV